MRLMVVDDEIDVQYLFEQRFRKEIKSGEIKIEYAFNGRSALNLIETIEDLSEFLILTDINMPEMTGIELLKEIKLRFPKLRVIVITAYGDENNVTMAKNLGADDYFTKPLEFSVLKARINSYNTL
jgi:CheY-like chemotaxis protein